MKQPTWNPVTTTEQKPDTDPLAKPLDFTMTPADRSTAARAMVDVIAMQRNKSAQEFANFTPGLVVTVLYARDLTPNERKAFGLEPEA